MPPDKRTGGPPGPPVTDSPPPAARLCLRYPLRVPSAGDLLALSDERDLWLTRQLAAERAAYQRGFDDGRATACVALAEIEERYAQLAWWHQWWARVWRLIEAETDPDAKRRRTEREITADQRFTRGARLKQAERPGALTPLESCVLRRIHPGDPGAEVSDAPR